MRKMILISAVIFFACCKVIKNTTIGTAPPRVEDEHTVLDFLMKERIKPSKIFSVTPDSFYGVLTYLSYSVLVFDKWGNHLSFGDKSGKYCYQTLPDSLSALQKMSNPNICNYSVAIRLNFSPGSDTPTSRLDTIPMHLNSFSHKFHDFKGGAIEYRADSSTDYIIVFPFAIYYGNKIQTKEIRRYIKAAFHNRSVKFEIILFNLDKQRWWGQENLDKIQFDVK
jgi:hypothetical protein